MGRGGGWGLWWGIRFCREGKRGGEGREGEKGGGQGEGGGRGGGREGEGERRGGGHVVGTSSARPTNPPPPPPTRGERSGVRLRIWIRIRISDARVLRRGLTAPTSSLLPTPYSLLPTPYSLLPTPYSLLPTPYSLLPTPYSLLPTPYPPLPPVLARGGPLRFRSGLGRTRSDRQPPVPGPRSIRAGGGRGGFKTREEEARAGGWGIFYGEGGRDGTGTGAGRERKGRGRRTGQGVPWTIREGGGGDAMQGDCVVARGGEEAGKIFVQVMLAYVAALPPPPSPSAIQPRRLACQQRTRIQVPARGAQTVGPVGGEEGWGASSS